MAKLKDTRLNETLSAGSADLTNYYTKTQVDNLIPSVPTALSSLSEDATHRLVTDTEKSTWSGKQDTLGFTPLTQAQIRRLL